MPENESPECSTGEDEITPMEEGEINQNEPFQQIEDLYTTAQINQFLERTKGKSNISLASYCPDNLTVEWLATLCFRVPSCLY